MQKYFFLSTVFWPEKNAATDKTVWLGACLEHYFISQANKLSDCIYEMYRMIAGHILISRKHYDGTLNPFETPPDIYQKIADSALGSIDTPKFNNETWVLSEDVPIYLFLNKKICENIWQWTLSDDKKHAILIKTGEYI